MLEKQTRRKQSKLFNRAAILGVKLLRSSSSIAASSRDTLEPKQAATASCCCCGASSWTTMSRIKNNHLQSSYTVLRSSDTYGLLILFPTLCIILVRFAYVFHLNFKGKIVEFKILLSNLFIYSMTFISNHTLQMTLV